MRANLIFLCVLGVTYCSYAELPASSLIMTVSTDSEIVDPSDDDINPDYPSINPDYPIDIDPAEIRNNLQVAKDAYEQMWIDSYMTTHNCTEAEAEIALAEREAEIRKKIEGKIPNLTSEQRSMEVQQQMKEEIAKRLEKMTPAQKEQFQKKMQARTSSSKLAPQPKMQSKAPPKTMNPKNESIKEPKQARAKATVPN